MVDAGRSETPRRALQPSPGAHWLRGYPRAWWRPDLVAGLTAAAVVVPKAMAYATVAGLPVQVGLYTAFVPMVIYALLGSSRPLSVSTTTTLAILTASALGVAAPAATPRRSSRRRRRWRCWSARCSWSRPCCGSGSSPTSSPSRC
jgi:MFS superfamily sulfate permease-like transporter